MRKMLATISIAVAVLAGTVAATAYTPSQDVPRDFQNSWTEAVQRGLIKGDPAYYYTGQATQEEVNHALLTAILSVDTQSKP